MAVPAPSQDGRSEHAGRIDEALPSADEALRSIELARMQVSRELDAERRDLMGQFLTPALVAGQLAALLPPVAGHVRIADPGAGIGSLGAAVVARLLRHEAPPESITLTAWEVDPELTPGLGQTMDTLATLCADSGVAFTPELRQADFLADGVRQISAGRWASADLVIMNPPYRKIHTRSPERALCREIGLEATNLYAAFLAVAAGLLRPEGEMAAIVPRSFANGAYFRLFRQYFNERMVFRRIHVYDSRSKIFSDDEVLQENIIFRAVRTSAVPNSVSVTSSAGPGDRDCACHEIPYRELIRPGDRNQVIRVVADAVDQRIAQRVESLPRSLGELGLKVSTGRVIEFRAREFLLTAPGKGASPGIGASPGKAPLVYPGHLQCGQVFWPGMLTGKNNAIRNVPASEPLLVPEGLYVLTKRFTSKEERRRIVAALYDPDDVAPGPVGFENHLNYYHREGCGLDRDLALGLRAFLNSTLVDLYFRQFSGHTQVNAGDLRSLRYPSEEQLRHLGRVAGEQELAQQKLDQLIDRELFTGADGLDPVRIRYRVDDAREMLRRLGLPRRQINERAALTLLAVLRITPDMPWSKTSCLAIDTTEIAQFIRDHYGKAYVREEADPAVLAAVQRALGTARLQLAGRSLSEAVCSEVHPGGARMAAQAAVPCRMP